MTVPTIVRAVSVEEAAALTAEGAALVDLRPLDDYLEVHVPQSLALVYEFGPGMAGRARDCLPLDVPLVLLDPGGIDIVNAAASLRGKGFTVVGALDDGLNAWAEAHGAPASTEIVEGAPVGAVLDVGDPGAQAPGDATRIPIELLWGRQSELGRKEAVTIAAGYGVRAALAVGILERAGVGQIYFWRTPIG